MILLIIIVFEIKKIIYKISVFVLYIKLKITLY